MSTRRTVTFVVEVTVDEDQIRDYEEDDPNVWASALDTLTVALTTICHDNLEGLDANVTTRHGSTGILYHERTEPC